MSKSFTLHATAFLLTVASGLHLIRALAGWGVSINGWTIPVWASVVLFAIAGALAFKMWKLAK